MRIDLLALADKWDAEGDTLIASAKAYRTRCQQAQRDSRIGKGAMRKACAQELRAMLALAEQEQSDDA